MQDVFDKVKMLSDVEHVLLKPTMWIGNNKPEVGGFYIYDDSYERFTTAEITHVKGVMKLIDEIISNSVDEFRRNQKNKTKNPLNRIYVEVHSNGKIVVWDNGGIPAEIHPEYKMPLIEVFFGNLRSSTNYDESENRQWVGTNGVGSALTNIFSSKYIVKSGIHGKYCEMTWTNNLSQKSQPIFANDKHFKGTRTEFDLDLYRFEMTSIDLNFSKIIEKRCIDAAATNRGLEVEFNYFSDINADLNYKSLWKFENFRSYVDLYNYPKDQYIGFENQDWEFYVIPTENSANIGFVNSGECNKGTHFKHIHYWCHNIIENHFIKKYKWKEVPKNEVSKRLAVFININVNNPVYDSQTKENLTTSVNKYYEDGHHPDMGHTKFIVPFLESELPAMILDWNANKQKADQSKALRQANKENSKKLFINKLVEANERKNRDACDLWIFEGDSAASGFRTSRDSNFQACYKLRGKVMNTLEMNITDVIKKNKEFGELVAATGLKYGEPNNVDSMRYGRIILCTDMDVDGYSIEALLMVFFHTHFKGVIEQKRLYRAVSPIVIAKSKKETKYYYSLSEYYKEENQLRKEKWTVSYIKGIGSLEPYQYKDLIQNPRLELITINDIKTDETIWDWFGGDANRRKKYLEEITL